MRFKSLKPADWMLFILLGAASSLVIIFSYWYKPRFLVEVDLKALDAMFSLRASVTPPKEVVIVAVDEKSVNALGRWPWTRTKTAGIFKRLKSAKAVAVDIVYSEPESKEADSVLAKAIAESGNVVLGFFFRDDSTKEHGEAELSQIKRAKIGLVRSIGADGSEPNSLPVVEFSGVETNIPGIGAAASGFGVFNIIPQEDGIYRVSNLVFLYDGDLYPTLAVSALKKFYNGDAILYTAPYGIDSLEINAKTIPLNEEGAFQLNFYGPGGSFKTYPAIDVISGKVAPDTFKDKLVFVGVTEKGIYDIRPTPVDALFPGVEILATIAGNVIDNRFLIHDTRVTVFDLAMIVVMAVVLSAAIAFVSSTFASLLIFAGLTLALIVLDFFLFSSYNIRPGVVYPVLSLLLTYVSTEAFRTIVVEKKSRFLKKAFSTYVSPQLVAELSKNPDSLKLGGEKREISVLFSYIRGFTTLSERLTPVALVALLNEYLNPMTRIVLSQEGTLDKYIGDAIMAVFNAPVAIENHPRKACSAAVEMMDGLNKLNEGWRAQGIPSLDIGVGINTGEAVVGNMGAELRFDYTAIGDTVNLASRLEGMNKLYGTHVLVSEFTYNHVKDDFLFREIDLVRVKGKLKPIVVYELAGRKADPRAALVQEYSVALGIYRARRFQEAKTAFEAILERYPDDGPSRLYVQRCADYIAAPPLEDWDGVYVAKTK